MAEPLAVVNVGKSEWLFPKLTPCLRIQSIVGASVAFTDPPRKPSKTKITILCGMAPIGCVCSEKKVEDAGQAAAAATSRTKIFFIGIPQNRNSYLKIAVQFSAISIASA